MTKISCFSALLLSGKKRSKVTRKVADANKANGNDCPKVKPVEFIDMAATADVGKCCDKTPPCDMKVVTGAVAEALYECSDKYGEQPPTRRNDFDLHARANSMGSNSDGADKDAIGASLDAMLACGRASDPGVGRMTEPASSKLKRSCSNIETKRSSPKALDLPARSRSYDDLKNLTGSFAKETIPNGALDASPASVKTSCTADRVMLKKRSSSQVLPSRSRKLWWKLFLWSHRNLHRPWAARPTVATADAADASDQHGGYTSDTMDGGSTVVDSTNKEVMTDEAPIPNQWVAFSAEASSLDRVNAWVNSLDDGSFCIHEEHDMDHEDGVAGHSSLEIGESSGENHSQVKRRAAEEVSQANSIIRSLSAFSSVAHISGMGLKVIPMISAYSSLRAINLSNNFIVHISPGSLPKVLHSLDLSRNKIANMEGLRELTKLRVLNLSYNRISRIGHGLSNCTAIKELYLAGNKISNVEGLHRLLKLTVLDLSFNKITTTKALGQLVANYSSLLALNLLGNPIQANIGDDALRKAVSGLLPQLTYLNKQTVKPQRAREVATDSVAKAALGNSGWSPRRRTSRRLSQSPSSSVKSRTGEGSSSHRGSRSRSKNRHQCSSLTRK